MGKILTKQYWDKVWKWCKINWKFIVGFILPFFIFYFIYIKKSEKVILEGIKFRKKEIDILNNINKVESDKRNEIANEFKDSIDKINEEHDINLKRAKEKAKKEKEEIESSNVIDITERLANKFDLDNKDTE